MSEKVKKLRVKQKDGTMSDYIPIGSEAKYVDTENGSTVEVELSKTTKYYDCVADMKQDTHLRGGTAAVTLGYYKPNDGGGALYQIIDATAADFDTLTDDGGSVHDLENNLKAKLIIEDSINVKQFGAYGDGEHDDTNAIQKTINYCKSTTTETLFKKNVQIIIPTGKYCIHQTIKLPPYIKIKGIGHVILFSYIDNGACVEIRSENQFETSDEYYIKKHTINNGYCLDNLIIYYKGELNYGDPLSTMIGLKIGTEITDTETPIATISLNDIRIYNFNIGLLLSKIDMYIVTFYHFVIEHNYINVKYGETKGEVNNAGENIVFNNCCLAGANYSIYWNASGALSTDFNDCSFDFNGCVFYFPEGVGTININIYGGHLERVGWNNPNISGGSNTPGYGTVAFFDAQTSYPNTFIGLNFFGTQFYFDNNDFHNYKFLCNVKDNLGVSFHNIRTLYMHNNANNINDTFLCSPNVLILNSGSYDFLSSHNTTRNRVLLSKRLDKYGIEDLTEISSTKDEKTGYQIAYNNNCWNIVEEAGPFSKKILSFNRPTHNQITLFRHWYINGHRFAMITPVFKTNILSQLKMYIGYTFFDKNGVQIGERESSTDDTLKFVNAQNEQWNRASSSYIIELPEQADSVRIYLFVTRTDSQAIGQNNYFYLDGLYINSF